MTDALNDAAARDAIRTRTDATLFVDAGAGSGKTTALIGRILRLLLVDEVPIGAIAAVTFTERAAGELRERLRTALESEPAADVQAQGLIDDALEGLDLASIGTLHAFAQQLLLQHPIEAGIPPLVEVLDAVGSSVAFEARWVQIRSRLLEDPTMADALSVLFGTGTKIEQLRPVITTLNNDWDLVESHVLAKPSPPITVPDLTGLVSLARRIASEADTCKDPEDKFVPYLRALAAWAENACAADGLASVLQTLQSGIGLKFQHGKASNWEDLKALKTECGDWQGAVAVALEQILDAALRVLVQWCGREVLTAARARQADGQLEFHDLLVLARNVLRADAGVRQSLHERYRHLLLDEFQDTDPIQVEIAVRIAGGAEAGEADWHDAYAHVPAGSLFVVGDPKQSIYRFRRADIAVYLDARAVIGEPLSLTTNFRSSDQILDWVNSVFGQVIQPVDGGQPDYAPLDAHRPAATVGAAVTVLGPEPHVLDGGGRLYADQLRAVEAKDVAAAITRALHEGWTVFDESSSEWRTIQHRDITVLIPARTSLPMLENALDAAAIEYRTEASSLVYSAPEVRSLMAAARAVADPTDALSLVTALRSPLFGCGDDDLWSWRADDQSFNILRRVDEDTEHPVGKAIAYLGSLHRRSRWLAPSELLGQIVHERRMLEVAAWGPRARDSWRRLRYVVDQARAWADVEHGGLRAYLLWAAAQGAETAQAAESVLPESDVDAVRVMTVHAAKGLEFPMVVMSGLGAQHRNSFGVRILWNDNGYEAAINKKLTTGEFDARVPIDEQMGHLERDRLMYVAATRARDHLVVSLHRSGSADTNASRLADCGATEFGAVTLAADPSRTVPAPSPRTVTAPPDFAEWSARLTRALARTAVPSSASASGLEGTEPDALRASTVGVPATTEDETPEAEDLPAGTAKGSRDLGASPWTKGRYGSAVGRAVHGVLQLVNLQSGAGLENAVKAQVLAEGVVDFEALVTQLVRVALASDIVQRAAVRPHWRESFVGMEQPDGTILEGVIDLMYREDDGSIVVVDYKTDQIPEAALSTRADFYAPQVAAYRSIVETAIGDSVAKPHLLFVGESGAFDVPVGPR